VERRGQIDHVVRTDCHPGAHVRRREAREGGRHLSRSLACCNHSEVPRTDERHHSGDPEGALERARGTGGFNGRAEDGEAIPPEAGHQASQFTFLGSDQADNPVTTSIVLSNLERS